MPTLNDLRAGLSEQQRAVLGAIWRYYIEKGKWISRRVLHVQFGGKTAIRPVLAGLGGSVVFEGRDDGQEAYRLTLLGVLLSDQGLEAQRLLTRYLDWVRKMVLDDPEIDRVQSAEVQTALRLSTKETQTLGRLIGLGPLWSGSATFGSAEWSAGLPYDVEDISEDVQAHLEHEVFKDYEANMPFEEGLRQSYWGARAKPPALEVSPDTTALQFDGRPALEYNLTDRQRRILRALVELHWEGHTREFIFAPTMGTEPVVEVPGVDREIRAEEGDLMALEVEGLVLLRRPDSYSMFGSLRQRAFDAVASNFGDGSLPAPARPSPPSPTLGGAMERRGKWEPIKELGEGGQGKVFVALDTAKVSLDDAISRVQFAVQSLAGAHTPEERQRRVRELATGLKQFDAAGDPANLGALKILHPPKDPAGLEKARARMENEVRAYGAVTHPNLLRLLDNRVTEGWFVTEYHPLGPLSDHLPRYQGDPLGALIAVRPLVEAVAALHSKGLVHRDIKPGNIFVRPSGDLILGDAGLVFFTDDQRTRVSDRIENVGSRDWMPGWAMGTRLDEVRPTFDVFALGKVLWAMVSGKPILQLWYHRQPRFDLERQFPDDERMPLVNRLLDGCVVEHEEHMGFPSAVALLSQTEAVLTMLRRGGQIVHRRVERRCGVCGLGGYQPIVDETSGPAAVHNFGLNPVGGQRWRIFRCARCGHIQMFQMNPSPPAWGEV